VDAVITTAWEIPSESVNETEHDRAVGTYSIIGEDKAKNQEYKAGITFGHNCLMYCF